MSSLHDLIMEASTSWVSLGSSSKIMGSHPRSLHLAHGKQEGVEERRYKDSLRYGKIIG